MKRTLFAMMMVVQMLSAFSARAEEAPKSESFQRDRLWYAASLPLYILTAGIVVHEGSHALAVGLDDDFELIRFRPYPHYTDDGRGLVGGSIDVRCTDLDPQTARCADKTGLGVIAGAPYITDTVFFVTADLLLSTGAVNPDGMMGLALYLAGMGSSWYDFASNLIWAIDGSDPDQMARNFAIPRWSVVATASALSAVGLWRLWVNGRRVFWDADPSGKESKLTIMPMTSPESFGVWAEVRF